MLMSTLITFTGGCLGAGIWLVLRFGFALQQQSAGGIVVHVRAVITCMQKDDFHRFT